MQLLLAYNEVMNLSANEQREKEMISMRSAPDPLQVHTRFYRGALVAVALLSIGVLGAACGGGAPSQGVASVGNATSTSAPSTGAGGSTTSLENSALAYVACMRTNGEPNMPNLTVDGSGVHIDATPGSGFDPNTPQYAAANKTCQHLFPKKGAASSAGTITPADQADYLKAAACMRSHGVPNFPDPTFQNNSVEFNDRTPIDTNSPQYQGALAICQKLIPTGLPYSSTSGS